MEYVLKTNSLCKNYGHFKALNGLSMNVPKGSIYGLIGKNGAGKTTLIRLICGLQEPTSGDYVLYGKKHIDKDITKSRRRMGAIVETPSIYVDLTAYDNLKEQYKVLGIPSDDGISEILKLVGLENTGNKKAKNFSLGMRQRLGIAVLRYFFIQLRPYIFFSYRFCWDLLFDFHHFFFPNFHLFLFMQALIMIPTLRTFFLSFMLIFTRYSPVLPRTGALIWRTIHIHILNCRLLFILCDVAHIIKPSAPAIAILITFRTTAIVL